MNVSLFCLVLAIVIVCKCGGLSLQDVMRNRCKKVFPDLSDEQLTNIDAISEAYLGKWRDINQLAYILATAWIDSRLLLRPEARIPPNIEMFGFVGDHWSGEYYGRGFVKIRFRETYEHFKNILDSDIVNNPDLVNSDPKVAARILIEGMVNGHFTGMILGEFINPRIIDWTSARRSVDGLNKAQEVAEIATKLAEMGD